MTKKRTRMTNKSAYSRNTKGRKSLAFIAQVLRDAKEPLKVRQIVDRIVESGVKITSITSSQTPYNTIARDIAMDLIEKGEKSLFVRVGHGQYAIRAEPTDEVSEAA